VCRPVSARGEPALPFPRRYRPETIITAARRCRGGPRREDGPSGRGMRYLFVCCGSVLLKRYKNKEFFSSRTVILLDIISQQVFLDFRIFHGLQAHFHPLCASQTVQNILSTLQDATSLPTEPWHSSRHLKMSESRQRAYISRCLQKSWQLRGNMLLEQAAQDAT